MEKPQQKINSLISGAGVGLFGRFAGRFFNVFENLIAARALGPAEFGLYSIGWTIFRLIELVSPVGGDMGIIAYGANNMTNSRALKGFFLVSACLSLLFSSGIGLMVYHLSPWISLEIFDHKEMEMVLKVFAFAIPFSGILGILSSASRLTHNMSYTAATQDLGQPLLAVLILGGFYFIEFNLRSFVVADLLSYVAVVALACYFIWRIFPFIFKLNVSAIMPSNDYYRFSFISAATMLLSTLVFWVDRLFVGYYLSAYDMGIYQSALQVVAIFAVILSALNRVLMPIFASIHHEKEPRSLEEIFRVGTKWTLYISLPIFLQVLANPRGTLLILFGEEYTIAWNVLIVLLAGQLINIATGAVGPLLLVSGHQRTIFSLSGLTLGISILLCIILIPRYGLTGAALSNAASVSIMYLTALMMVKLRMNIWPYDFRFLKGGLAVLAAAGAAFGIGSLLDTTVVLNIAAQFAATVVTFVLALYLLKLDREDRTFLRMIAKWLHLHRDSDNRNSIA